MKVKHADAVSFFVNLGFSKAPSWKPEAFTKRFAGMAEIVEDPEFRSREGNLSAGDKKLLKGVLAANKAKEEIEIVTEAAVANGKPAKGKDAAKPSKTNGATKKDRAPRDFSKSNKAKVYNAWIKSKKKEEDPAKLMKVTDGTIKESTIKQWISWWKRGEALPAIARQ